MEPEFGRVVDPPKTVHQIYVCLGCSMRCERCAPSATGGASPDVFMLAVTRASEICIGIGCAGIVLTGTDLGGAQRRLAESFANLAAQIMGRFIRMLDLAEPQLPDTKAERREFVRRVIALDPVIDQAL